MSFRYRLRVGFLGSNPAQAGCGVFRRFSRHRYLGKTRRGDFTTATTGPVKPNTPGDKGRGAASRIWSGPKAKGHSAPAPAIAAPNGPPTTAPPTNADWQTEWKTKSDQIEVI